jgi:NADP-dependent 3-hydroxy acid dehydrogenase YdfG
MNGDKAKKIVVITGVTRGLGRAMADKLIALGHTVLGCGRSLEIIEQLRAANTKRHDFDVVDVRSDDQVRDWVARLHKKCGAPDFVLNNAATTT